MVKFVSAIVDGFILKFFLSYFLYVSAPITTKVRDDFGILR